jgi:hypothetical protein
LQVNRVWAASKKEPGKSSALCKCGGSKLKPANATILDDLFNPCIWELWFRQILLPWLKSKFKK